MPSLADQLASYLKPLNGLRENPYQTMTGRSGNILATGSPTGGYRANDTSPAGMVGDSGPSAEYDRALAAEGAASRSADLTNWLDKQAANRVPAQLEQDDPATAAKIRATQIASLHPESTARPEYDALMKILQFETPTATRARGRQVQERTGEAVGLDTARSRAAGQEFRSPGAIATRRMVAEEARRNAGRSAQDKMDEALSPGGQILQDQETAAQVAIAKARVPRDAITASYENTLRNKAEGAAPGTTPGARPRPAAGALEATEDEVEQAALTYDTTTDEVKRVLIAKGYKIVP